MRKFLPLILLLFISCHVHAQAPIPTSGLVAYYPFCGNYNDVSGSGYNLHDSNTTFITDRFGIANQSCYFNGTNSLLYINLLLPTPGDFTYACWIMPYSNLNACVMYNGNTNADGYGFVMNDGSCSGFGNLVSILFGGIDCSFESKGIVVNQWHHLVFRRTGSTFDLFIDTVLAMSKTGSFNPPSGKFQFGLDYTNGTNPFYGRIDDAAVYNRAITSAEIGKLYRGCQEMITTQPVSVSTTSGGSISFSITASVSPATYQWQYNNGSGWVNLTSTSPYSGVTTTTLTISPVSSSLKNYLYRCLVSNPYCCSVPSDSAQLKLSTVSDSLYITATDTGCNTYKFTAFNKDTTIISHYWKFGDGKTDTGNPVWHKYTAAGTYLVTVTTVNKAGDSNTASYTVTIANNSIRAFSDTLICIGASAQLRATGGTNYSWSPAGSLDNAAIADPVATPQATTTYIVTGIDNQGCPSSDSVTVTVVPLPNVTAGINTKYQNCKTHDIQLIATGASHYYWSPGIYCNDSTSATPIVSIPSATLTFTVRAIDSNGCEANASIKVDKNKEATVALPSAFSPNADGKNDILYIRGANIQSVDFSIFNRWGQRVFQTNNINQGWDGTFNGSPQPLEVYAYVIKITNADGCAIEKKGSVTLLR